MIIYRLIISIILFFLPLIIVFRLIKKKEHPQRFLEKLGFFNEKKIQGKLIWIHGSSVGEILSVIPLIEKLERSKDIKQILITSNTLSSSKVLKKFKFKKTIHQFFPFDAEFINKKFLNYWKPNIVLFIESEIWPNMIFNIKQNNIPLILLNARITKKSFSRWKKIDFFSKYIFNRFNLCLASNNETKYYLKKLGAKNIKMIGNIKFTETNIKTLKKFNKNQENFLKSKKILFSAVSTHYPEEIFCAKIHRELIKKFNNALTIIIPRHIHRSSEIKNELENMGLNVYTHSSKNFVNKNTDIYLVDTYGEIENFLKISKVVFLGGSLINHGGQNPLEPARLGCKVIHGPNIDNFREIYFLLKQINVSTKINGINQAKLEIIKNLNNKSSLRTNTKKLNYIGKDILLKNQKEISKFL